jgi:polynucleotide 5'-kinase involved in rRNA processing
MLELPPEWEEALVRAGAATRVAVLGPPDSGKSAFVAALAERRPECRIIAGTLVERLVPAWEPG